MSEERTLVLDTETIWGEIADLCESYSRSMVLVVDFTNFIEHCLELFCYGYSQSVIESEIALFVNQTERRDRLYQEIQAVVNRHVCQGFGLIIPSKQYTVQRRGTLFYVRESTRHDFLSSRAEEVHWQEFDGYVPRSLRYP